MRFRSPYALVLGALAVVACAPLTAASGVGPFASEDRPADLAPSASPTPSPTFNPGPDSLSGKVVRRSVLGIVVDSAGTETEVDLRSVVNVWRETSVPAIAIEVGDAVFVNGTRGPSSFVARYVYANIGRIDGTIRSFDSHEMLLAISRPGADPAEVQVELSRDVEIVQLGPGGERPGDLGDLSLGRSVGMVVYRELGGTARATRIWYTLTPSNPPTPDRVLRRPTPGTSRSVTPVLINAVRSAGTFSILFAGAWRYDARISALYADTPNPELSEHPRGGLWAVERMRATPGGYLIAKELAIREQGVERVVYRAPGDGFYWSGWSPDGRYVALWEIDSYSGSLDMDGRPLVIVDVRTGERVDLGPTLLYGTTAWTAPHTLAYIAGQSRMVWDTKVLRLWSPESGIRDVTTPDNAAFAPAWSADGRALYFIAGPAGDWDPVSGVAGRGIGERRIHVYDPASGAIRSLAHESGREEEGVRPSRDGTRLLVLRRTTAVAPDVRSIPNVDLEVWLTDADGGHGSALVRFPNAGLNAYGYLTGPSEWDWSE